jgi:hypothetical protein
MTLATADINADPSTPVSLSPVRRTSHVPSIWVVVGAAILPNTIVSLINQGNVDLTPIDSEGYMQTSALKLYDQLLNQRCRNGYVCSVLTLMTYV